MSARIIVAGPLEQHRRELRAALEFEGYEVLEADTAEPAIREARSGTHDALILDAAIAEAGLNELCRAIRPRSDLGIIVVNGGAGHRSIDALNAGADDYVPAPLVAAELLARVRALLRRVVRSNEEGRKIVLRDRAIDLKAHKVKGPDGRVSHLTPKEFLVLRYLIAHANKPRTHQSLAQTVWQRDGCGEVEYVRVVIKQLRRKLEPDPDNPQYILTERSVGYRFHIPSTGERAAHGR